MIIKLIQPKMNKRPMDTDLKTRIAVLMNTESELKIR